MAQTNAKSEFKEALLCSPTRAGHPRLLFILLHRSMLHSLKYFSPIPTAHLSQLTFRNNRGETQPPLLEIRASIEHAEDNIHSDLVNFNTEKARLAMKDDGRKGKFLVHQMLRLKAIEALAWATSKTSTVPFQIPLKDQDISANTKVIHDKLQANAVTNWLATVRAFIAAFGPDEQHILQPSASEDSGNATSIAGSLLSLLQHSSEKRLKNTIMQNVSAASLSLRCLAEVRNIHRPASYLSSQADSRGKYALRIMRIQ